ncbi:MAG: RidA family protein [Nocardioides sp.]
MKTSLNPTTVAHSPFYAQGIEVTAPSRTVYVSGQVGADAAGEPLEGIEAQARQAIANLGEVLGEAGLTADDIVKMTIYLTSTDDVGPFMGAAAATLPAEPPATTLLIVASLADPRLLVEIEAVAAA